MSSINCYVSTILFLHNYYYVNYFDYEGRRFQPSICCPYDVAKILNQTPGKLRAKDLKEGKILCSLSLSKPLYQWMLFVMLRSRFLDTDNNRFLLRCINML